MSRVPNSAGGMPPTKYELVRLAGGLDQVTPTLSLQGGVIRRAVNFECSITGGYTRIAGYERYDGRPAPSDASYTVLTGRYSADVVAGDILKGQASGVQGEVFLVHVGALVLTKCTGEFIVGEIASRGDEPIMLITDISISPNGRADAVAYLMAQDVYRKDILPVPGSGPVRGVCYYNEKVYAWRDTPDGTALGMYKSSPQGWLPISYNHVIQFEKGTVEPKPKQRLFDPETQGLCTVLEVSLDTGDWKNGDAAGYISITAPSFPMLKGNLIQCDGDNSFTAATDATEVVLKPGGRVTTVNANFSGYSENPKVFGADGVNPAFELNEDDTYVQIYTGTPGENPQLAIVHQNHLFLAFGDSMLHSAINDPHNFDPVKGAGEIKVIEPITEWLVQAGNQSTGALTVYTRNNIYILYGTTSENWQLAPYNIGTGARKYTGQNMADSYVLDDRGIMSMTTSLNYGNFDSASLTLNIRDFIQMRRNLAVGSCLNRAKSQYRVFFSDGTGLYLTVDNGQKVGAMPVMFPNKVSCIVEGEKPDGSETSFFGSDNGFVYRLDVGGNFDGENIFAAFDLIYNPIKSPQVLKRFRKASLEMNGSDYVEIDFGYSFSYGTGYMGQNPVTTPGSHFPVDLRPMFFDEFYFDHFLWDRQENAPLEIALNGTAENISFRIRCDSNLYAPFTVNSIMVNYTPRRGLR